jgi:3-(3-hydroxy-phenyl)propionate hydroxylase
MHAKETAVVVVGAGPVGLTAARYLSQRGIAVTVLEASSSVQTDWRASTFHAATLELLDDIDITEAMCAEGLAVPVYQYRDRQEGVVAEFDLSSIADATRYPYRLQLNQQRYVAMLAERIAADPRCEIRFGQRVTGVRSSPDHCAVDIAGEEQLHCDFLLAADGAASTVRKSLDVPFDGMTYAQRFLIVSVEEDLRKDCIADIADVCYVSDPEEFLFLLRTPDSWRVVFPIPADEIDEVALSSPAIQRRLRGFHDLGRSYGILDRQVYGVHQRVAESFRVGRAVLLGDAAHINSPLGGMGLNSGIHDAIDIGRRLWRVLEGPAAVDVELDAYAAARHHVAVEYVRADTHRNTTTMAERDPAMRAANHRALAATAADPQAARAWMMRSSMLAPVAAQGIGRPPVDAVGTPAALGS